jgi:hypothetical protein
MMKTTCLHPGYPAAALFASCLLISLATCSLLQININAQQGCPEVPRQNSPGWRSGANVTLVFDENSTFSSAEIAAIQRAFQNWNASNGSGGNNSRVNFQGVTFGAPIRGPRPDYTVATGVYFVERHPMTGSTAPASTFVTPNANSGSDKLSQTQDSERAQITHPHGIPTV